MQPKDKKIIEDCIEGDIPMFVIAAKDSTSVDALQEYYIQCFRAGANNEHLAAVRERINEFTAWQARNHDRVKIPD